MTTQSTQLPTTIDAVIARMEQVDAELDPRDGVACFNRMYLKVTKLVKEKVAAGGFEDNAFMERMDVLFAGLYLANVDAAKAGKPVDPAWEPLFRMRGNRVVWPIQFALAGMNAHIDHDLAISVVETCKERGTAPERPPVHRDYEKVNDLLASVEAEVRAEFEGRLVRIATAPAESLKHAVSGFSIRAARDVAWGAANGLWAVRGLPFAYNGQLALMAQGVRTTSHGILVPVVPPPAG
ncbi:DUF5995 family protein [Kitasatospora sp. NPDC048538]|uniref:DUF5995 family protein n=1 Tax=unclassified Kitasatospora TaxID=2633591 RepID=UPI0033CFDD84